MEPALELLCDNLKSLSGDILLVADEQLDSNHLLGLKTLPNLSLLSNRYDVVAAAKANNIESYFNDMDLKSCGKRFDVIAYRISKEKAVVHHLINQTPYHLKPGGQLMLCGYKSEGIKTYISKTEAYLGCKTALTKGPRQLKLAHFSPQAVNDPLDDKDYRKTINITPDHTTLLSKPGQFGWNKIDQGSALLIEQFKQFLNTTTEAPNSLLDLGCGYGYLSIQAANLGIESITATDNNAAAVESCRKNFQTHNVNGDVVADDCASSIEGQFDVVLCNPPFHKGFDTTSDLTEKFIKSAKAHLKKTGTAFFVVNQFIPLEQVAATLFNSVETVFNDNHFKVIKLSS